MRDTFIALANRHSKLPNVSTRIFVKVNGYMSLFHQPLKVTITVISFFCLARLERKMFFGSFQVQYLSRHQKMPLLTVREDHGSHGGCQLKQYSYLSWWSVYKPQKW